MNEVTLLKLLISMSDILIDAIKIIETANDDADETDRSAALDRLAETSAEVNKRLAEMEGGD